MDQSKPLLLRLSQMFCYGNGKLSNNDVINIGCRSIKWTSRCSLWQNKICAFQNAAEISLLSIVTESKSMSLYIHGLAHFSHWLKDRRNLSPWARDTQARDSVDIVTFTRKAINMYAAIHMELEDIAQYKRYQSWEKKKCLHEISGGLNSQR